MNLNVWTYGRQSKLHGELNDLTESSTAKPLKFESSSPSFIGTVL